MSNLAERPWNEEEKYTLLTEILKKARVPSSHLVKMIRDFGITPSWTDIPLPQGRSLNSCQMAFYNMCQHVPLSLSVNPARGPVPPHAHESAPPATAPLDPSALRKRPLFPLDKGIRPPRAIQPRPATSTASYSSESGASTLLSPSSESITVRGEPPRKRGRPSKAESERRKAAAEARGETYPPPRRSGSTKGKLPSAPTSPAGLGPGAPLFGPQVVGRPLNSSQSELHYPAPPRRPLSMGGAIGEARLQEMPSQELVPSMRELPRPPEMRQTLPSPQALQLGHRKSIQRRETGDRSFEPLLPDRTSFVESNRRNLIHPLARCPEEAHGTAPELLIERPAETRSE
ncbi:putative AT DNA binding protein [Aspergillus brunneoviolaceus CBS 621.78]|uniref:Uncharacterized protein n=1 Tax=Aspergillus brunneoviolaceus CBS 621.78 TaxID=1450534 RepID=A0ACD1FV55_9EURO|nr:hypothetical protein BO95DRAFT_282554 [Aspergillus brunneoviolaceus CBS 621.78]RAH40887.1 hypothetical protein BO95DRAFT_282554 [Aspergillus brunneoviolaceus CBS 621.78]